MRIEVQDLLVTGDTTIRDAMAKIDRGGQCIVLLVDDEGKFISTITDGDVRRAILTGENLNSPVVSVVRSGKHNPGHSITAPHDLPRADQIQLMRNAQIRHLPLLDQSGHVESLAMSDDPESETPLPVQAVIMAGGFGKRLRPLTDDVPKPMLPVAGQPLMERTVRGLQQAGIHRINITTHYMPEIITNYFGSGTRFGVDINYVSEDQPLGTAGALGLVDDVEEPLLVVNGDILTRVDFRELVAFHSSRNAELTVGVRQYDVELPYGVIEADSGRVLRLREKPKYGFLVNAGVYILQPAVRRLIPPGRRFDMTDLIEQLLEQGSQVACFPIIEYWMDIGQHSDFQQAQQDVRELRWAS